MSPTCTTCGRPLDADHDRCPTCGALASPAVDETTSLDAVDPTTAGDAPPWSIPIREPRTVRRGRSGGRGRAVGLAVLALAAFALTVALGSRVLGDDDAGTAARDSERADAASTDESGGMDAAAVRPPTTTTTTTTAPSTTTAEPTTTTTAPTPPAAPATTAAVRTPPNGTGSVPALSTSFRGWVAQVRSVPFDAGTARLAEEWERVRAVVPGVVATRSNDWSAFGDGFWVLVDPGPFASAAEVRSSCSSAGLDGDGECLARELRG